MSGDFYPTHHRGPPRRWYASRRARTLPPRALALRREQARVRESWVLAGRRSGTHTQSANFLSVHWRGLACACRGAARCSHKRGKLTGTQMSEFTRSLSCYPAPLSSQLDTNKRGNARVSVPFCLGVEASLFHPFALFIPYAVAIPRYPVLSFCTLCLARSIANELRLVSMLCELCHVGVLFLPVSRAFIPFSRYTVEPRILTPENLRVVQISFGYSKRYKMSKISAGFVSW